MHICVMEVERWTKLATHPMSEGQAGRESRPSLPERTWGVNARGSFTESGVCPHKSLASLGY